MFRDGSKISQHAVYEECEELSQNPRKRHRLLFYGFRPDIFNSLFIFVPLPAFVAAELSNLSSGP